MIAIDLEVGDPPRWISHPNWPDNDVWITAEGRRTNIDDMDETHVRNTLKMIMRHARAGQVWAISPKTGGLRRYNKGAPKVAKATVKKEAPKPVNPWDTVENVTLTLDKNEAQYLHKLIGNQPRTQQSQSIYGAFTQQGL